MTKKDHIHIPAQFDIDTLMNDIRNNGEITRGFNKTNTDNRIKIFDEYRENLDEYIEYALIFHDELRDAQDLVQHAFISAYESAESLDPDTDMRFWLLSHMQQELEDESNALYAISRQIIEATHAETQGRTIGETMHLIEIQRELSKTLSEMDEREMTQVIEYMRSFDETLLSDNIKRKLFENEALKDLHLNNHTHD